MRLEMSAASPPEPRLVDFEQGLLDLGANANALDTITLAGELRDKRIDAGRESRVGFSLGGS